MNKVKLGDLDMLGLLFERYHRMLFSFFYRIHQSAEISEDLVQNVFIRILRYRKGFNGEGAFKVWMFHIARNISHDHFRKEKKSVGGEDIDKWNNKISDFEHEQQKENKEDQIKLLKRAMELLDIEKRELLVMSKLEGIKYREIAELYAVTEGNIKVRVFRALKDLKSAYQKVEKMQNKNM